jgi:hypothetical protein
MCYKSIFEMMIECNSEIGCPQTESIKVARAHLKNTFWEFSASLPILLRWLSCPDSLWYELRKPPCIMAKYLKISSKLIFEMGSN